MTPERWSRVEQLFHDAFGRKPEERYTFLVQRCGGDQDLLKEVESLLTSVERAGNFVEGQAVDIAASLLVSTNLVGRRLSHYEIVSRLGAGGMAEVYRGRDTKLRRDVAIKVLPEIFGGDKNRIQRLHREAQVLASLNHPNIASIYGLEDDASIFGLVLELVEGDTLAERISRGRVPVQEALYVAQQLASALEAAHAKGIVHRDFKPANIKITPEGTIKVLDFGIAKIFGLDEEPTGISVPGMFHTGGDAVLGTVPYMSPEQTRGEPIDQRTDIWAWGCVFYEMLTGHRAFDRGTSTDVVSQIRGAEPDWSQLPEKTPAEIRALLRRCLQKDIQSRQHSIGDARVEIQELPQPKASRKLRRIAFALAAIGLAVAAWAAVSYWREPGVLSVAQTERITLAPELELEPALSPDGKMVAYASGTSSRMDLYVQQLAGGDPIPLTRSLPEAWHRWPRWSPDGTMIAFLSRDDRNQPALINTPTSVLRVMPSLGGTPHSVADAGMAGHAWSPDGTRLVYVRDQEIYVIRVAEGKPEKIAAAFEPHSPSWSPDGKWIAFASGNYLSVFHPTQLGNQADSSIAIVAAGGGTPHQLTAKTSADTSPVWTPDSRSLLFVSKRGSGRDVFQLKVSDTGNAVGIPERITTASSTFTIDLSRDGKQMVYSDFRMKSNLWSIPIPGTTPAAATDAKQLTTGAQMIEGIGVSPDSSWIVFDSDRSGNSDIYRMRRADGKIERLTTDPHDDFVPSFSPDGQSIAFYSFRNGSRDLYVMNSDGTGQQQVTDDPANEFYPTWSPDGRSLAFQSDKSGELQVYVVSRESAAWTKPGQLTVDGGRYPHWSPDGSMIALFSQGIRAMPSNGGAAKLLVSRKPALLPVYAAWSLDSRTIYFKANEPDIAAWSFWSVPASGGEPKLLIRFTDPSRVSERYEFATDGREFFFTITERESDIGVLTLRSR